MQGKKVEALEGLGGRKEGKLLNVQETCIKEYVNIRGPVYGCEPLDFQESDW